MMFHAASCLRIQTQKKHLMLVFFSLNLLLILNGEEFLSPPPKAFPEKVNLMCQIQFLYLTLDDLVVI